MNTKNKTKITLTSLAIIVASAIIVVIFGISSVRGASTKPKPPTWTPIPTDITNMDLVMIQSLEQDLQGELDEETRHSLETKLQILYAEVTQRAVAIQQSTAMPNRTFLPPTFQVEGQRDLGIIEYPTDPFVHTDYKTTNAWQELINGNYVTVFAGSLVSNPKQGIIIVQMETPRKTRIYLTPDQSGATKITSANGFRLVVETSDSKRYYFDVPTQRFATSMGEIIPTITPLPTPSPTPKPTATPSFPSQPLIHEQPGVIYETVFSISVGQESIIQYFGGGNTEVNGPNAIAVFPDESLLIADPVGNRLLRYNKAGSLLNTIELKDLGIGFVADLRIKGEKLFLLETSYQKFWVYQLTLDGALITSEEIPYGYSIGEKDYKIENVLTGIIIDCENRIILEIGGGYMLFPLSDVQNLSDPAKIVQGLLCNDKRYQNTTPGLWQDPQISIGSVNYQTKLTHGLGGLSFIDIFQNGNLYVDRSDVVNDQVIKVDQTVHFIDPEGNVQGVARAPLSEYYYPINRNIAISPTGEVFAILPRLNSIDIIRLNFYTHLDPLIPGAVTPQITKAQKSP